MGDSIKVSLNYSSCCMKCFQKGNTMLTRHYKAKKDIMSDG